MFSHGEDRWDCGGEKESHAADYFHTWRGKDLEANGFPGRPNEKNESRGRWAHEAVELNEAQFNY